MLLLILHHQNQPFSVDHKKHQGNVLYTIKAVVEGERRGQQQYQYYYTTQFQYLSKRVLLFLGDAAGSAVVCIRYVGTYQQQSNLSGLKKWPHTTTTFKCFPSQQQVLLDFYGLGNHKLHYPSFKLTYPKKFEIALPFQTITKRYSNSKIYRSITCCCNF